MLRVFRHIRQNMFQEDKVSRYFGYAFGEIVLIVIGILIALQISNWNDVRKDEQLGEELTRVLYTEMQEPHERSQIVLDLMRRQVRAIRAFLDEGERMDKEALKTEVNAKGVIRWAQVNVLVFEFTHLHNPRHSAYSAAVSNGSIALVQNETFKYLLEDNYIRVPKRIQDLFEREARINDELRRIIGEKYSDLFQEVNERRSQGDTDAQFDFTNQLLQDNEIRYHLGQKLGMIESRANLLDTRIVQTTEELIKIFQP